MSCSIGMCLLKTCTHMVSGHAFHNFFWQEVVFYFVGKFHILKLDNLIYS